MAGIRPNNLAHVQFYLHAAQNALGGTERQRSVEDLSPR